MLLNPSTHVKNNIIYYWTIYYLRFDGWTMNKDDLKNRLKSFALRIVVLVDNMPTTISSQAFARQIIRSGTSPFANYRAACLAKSDKDFLNKLKMVEEELDETSCWLELIAESDIIAADRLSSIRTECDELMKIIVASILTHRKNMDRKNVKSI